MLSRFARLRLERLDDIDLLARMLILVFGARSLLVASTTWRPAWDEMNYLHRAVCVNHTLFDWDWRGVHECLLGLNKSPALMLLLLPFGQIGDNVDLIRAAPTMLAILNFLLLLVIGLMTWQLRVPLAVALVATIAMAGNPWSHVVGGALLIDTCVGLVVTVAILLFAFEASSKAASGKSAALRGVFWGMVGTAGVMSKMTFGFFAILLFAPLVGVIWYREGLRHAIIRLLCCGGASIPGLIVFALYGRQYFWEATRSSFGSLAPMYADSLTLREFIVGQFMGTGLGGSVLLLMAAAVIVITVRRRAADWVVLYLLLVLLGYFWLVSNTVNRQARFLLPFWLALPWCLALVMRNPADGSPKGSPVRDFALAGAVSVFLALPSLKNYDLSGVQLSLNVLRTIPTDRAARILTASDSSDFNVESMLLAYELDRRRFPAGLSIDTLVYDGVNGRTLEQSLARLRAADVVLFRIPLDPAMAASWPNARYEEFLQVTNAEGRKIAVVGPAPSAHVYVMSRPPR
jgi:hypothetical protein